MSYHRPVLLNECIEGLNIKADGVYVDVTFGGGGHSKEILKHLKDGKLIAFDQDPDAMENAIDDPRFLFVNQNFRYLKRFLKLNQIEKVDGILADLGISSHQIDTPERGFSTRFDGPLDMRMDKSQGRSAADVINDYPEEALVSMFSKYGEIRNSKTLARRIVEKRRVTKIKTTSQLKMITEPLAKKTVNKYMATVFQSLRIEVNEEMASLEEFLLDTVDVLKSNGRLVVMSYHSLEDRLVKIYMRWGGFQEPERDEYGRFEVPFKLITKKIMTASEEEVAENPRARSAKLRIAEKI